MIEKLKYLASEICKNKKDFACVDIIENSEFIHSTYGKRYNWEASRYNVLFKVNPSVFIKYVDQIDRISGIIGHYMNISSNNDILRIDSVKVEPDYEKISILNSEISIIQTPWEEINSLQKKIICDTKVANTSIDFQNIGNVSRTIMDKLARLVFNPDIHISPKTIDVSNGKFKNQLHTYILFTLKGQQNKEMRQFSESAIDFMEKAIDLMNQTTHKLDVQQHFAEVCVISTISVINLIKTIHEI